jgi:hypothetical protein
MIWAISTEESCIQQVESKINQYTITSATAGDSAVRRIWQQGESL